MCWNQGLNFANIFTPWSCLSCVLWLQSRSCFAEFFLPGSVERVLEPGAYFLYTLLRPGLVYTVFCGSKAEVVLRQFLLPDSVERLLELGV